jgi:hypothetical protein
MIYDDENNELEQAIESLRTLGGFARVLHTADQPWGDDFGRWPPPLRETLANGQEFTTFVEECCLKIVTALESVKAYK